MKSDFQLRRLCLNMIVKNEGERIIRALTSVLPYVSCYAITDTGSTDNTRELIESFFADAHIPGEINTAEFIDFSQARNAALDHARAVMSDKPYIPYADYFLLMDADMELVVEDPKAFHNLAAPAYTIVQKAGSLVYANTRLVNTCAMSAKYVGVTHEYIDGVDATSQPPLPGVHFYDYADGANRPDKCQRDITLLTSALAREPNNGRYWYYLAQSHRDAHQFRRAAHCYKKRIELGGWDEETWSAQVGYATALKDQGLEAEFTQNMLKAYGMRPSRAETLYDLAHHYRMKGDCVTAMVFINHGLRIPKPTPETDILFINQFVYDWGFKNEYSICAYYVPEERAKGAALNDELSISKNAPDFVKRDAFCNRYWYLKSLADVAPSFTQKRLDFQPPHAGYTAMNPSVTTFEDKLVCNIRCVNYRMDQDGRYLINGTDGEANSTNPIDTKNFVVTLDDALAIEGVANEIVWHRPTPQFDLVTGMEDVRLYRDGKSDLWASATIREQNPGGVCQQVRFRLELDEQDHIWRVAKWNTMSGIETHEKNWMPVDGLHFMYRLDRVLTAPPPVHPELKHVLNIDVSDISGSSQLVPFKQGWLALVHEAGFIPGTSRRFYQHRFAWFDEGLRLRRLSLPFYFQDRQIEFCAGLTTHPNGHDLVFSYGIRDNQAWIGQISYEDVAAMLVAFHEN